MHPLLAPVMRELDYKYQCGGEYRQQKFVNQRQLSVQSATGHPKAEQIIEQGDGCTGAYGDRAPTKEQKPASLTHYTDHF